MLNVLALIFLLLFIFALLGTKLFKHIRTGMAINNVNTNFANFA